MGDVQAPASIFINPRRKAWAEDYCNHSAIFCPSVPYGTVSPRVDQDKSVELHAIAFRWSDITRT